MEGKKKRSTTKKKVKITEESPKTESQPTEQMAEAKREDKTEKYQETTDIEREELKSNLQVETESSPLSESSSSFVSQKISEIKNKINSQINMAKNMYMLFQGMKQSYGGDTKKVISVMLGFAREEGKRRLNNLKDKIRKKIFGELD